MRGRRIISPLGTGTRPTSDQRRETLFNILTHALWAPAFDQAAVLDIFAGSGALGLEALSRGARFCLFVETDTAARAAIRENIERMNLQGVTRLHRRDATQLKIAPANLRGPFQYIFMDPPYGQGLWQPVGQRLKACGLAAQDSVIIIETARDETVTLPDYAVRLETKVGAGRLTFLTLCTLL